MMGVIVLYSTADFARSSTRHNPLLCSCCPPMSPRRSSCCNFVRYSSPISSTSLEGMMVSRRAGVRRHGSDSQRRRQVPSTEKLGRSATAFRGVSSHARCVKSGVWQAV